MRGGGDARRLVKRRSIAERPLVQVIVPSASVEPDASYERIPAAHLTTKTAVGGALATICLLTTVFVPSLSVTVNVTKNVPPAT